MATTVQTRRIIAVILGALLALLLVEGMLWLTDDNTYQPVVNDKTTGLLTYEPNANFIFSSRCYRNEVKANSAGFYAPDYPRQKSAETFRILVTGSSFVEAAQIPLVKNFTKNLEEKLNARPSQNVSYEVYPLAFAGNGTYLDLLYLTHYGWPLEPDLVLELTTDFELSKSSSQATYPPRFNSDGKLALELPRAVTSPTATALKNILRRSKLAMNVYLRALVLKSNLPTLRDVPLVSTLAEARAASAPAENSDVNSISSVAQPREYKSNAALSPKANAKLWEIENKILNTFVAQSKTHDASFGLISWVSDPANMRGHTEFGEGLGEISKREGFPYLDLQPILLAREAREKVSPIWLCDGHWNETGHVWAAEAIYEWLKANPKLLLKKSNAQLTLF